MKIGIVKEDLQEIEKIAGETIGGKLGDKDD